MTKHLPTSPESVSADGSPPADERFNRRLKGAKRSAEALAGCLGADLAKLNYVKYLVARYHDCREADARFGRTGRVQYAAIFKQIEARFKASTYFIPESRFADLVDFLQGRIDDTALGKANSKRGIRNYRSFDEYVLEHTAPAVAA